MTTIEDKFDEFIASGIIDNNEFQEYEIFIEEFDNKIQKDRRKKPCLN